MSNTSRLSKRKWQEDRRVVLRRCGAGATVQASISNLGSPGNCLIHSKHVPEPELVQLANGLKRPFFNLTKDTRSTGLGEGTCVEPHDATMGSAR
jgi:hypothetical protein